jgi:hypothetical protein
MYWKEQRKALKGKIPGTKGADLDKIIEKNWAAMTIEQRQKYSKSGYSLKVQ